MNKRYFAIVAVVAAAFITILLLKKSSLHSTMYDKIKRVEFDGVKVINEMGLPDNLPLSEIIDITDSGVITLSGDFKSLIWLTKKGDIKNQINPQQIFSTANIDHINNVVSRPNGIMTLFAGNSGSIFTWSMYADSILQTHQILIQFNYTHAVLTPNNQFFFRIIDSTGEGVFFRKISYTHNIFFDKKDIVPKHNDGGLSTDGCFLYSNNKLYYINRYNDEITILDTSLNVIQKACSIDSSKRLPLVRYYPQIHSHKFSSPNVTINNLAAVNEKYLIINSLASSRNNCLDIYDAKTCKFIGTYYLKKKYGTELVFLKLGTDNTLYILTDKEIITTKIS